MKCWLKGTRSFMLETAIKDCTSAVELANDDFGPLDSRAMVLFKLGRLDDALKDLNAVLLAVPGLSPSRFLRGTVLNRLGRQAEGAVDLGIARRMDPNIDRVYARYNVIP